MVGLTKEQEKKFVEEKVTINKMQFTEACAKALISDALKSVITKEPALMMAFVLYGACVGDVIFGKETEDKNV